MAASTQFPDILRIAVAISAVKLKQPEQSYEALAISLRDSFASVDTILGKEPWRTHSLKLETELAVLKRKYEDDHIELLALRVIAPRPTTLASDTSTAKKKSKKKSAHNADAPAQSARTDLETALGPLDFRPDILAMPDGRSLFAAFEVLDNVNVPSHHPGTKSTPLAFFKPAADRAVHALGAVLSASVLTPTHPASAFPWSDGLTAVAALLPYFIDTVLPLLFAKVDIQARSKSKKVTALEAVDEVFRLLTSVVLVPIISSFTPLSSARLSRIFLDVGVPTETSTTSLLDADCTDVRPQLLCLFRSAVAALGGLSSHAAVGVQTSMRTTVERLVLAAVRELDVLSESTSTRSYHDASTILDEGALPAHTNGGTNGDISADTPRTAEPRVRRLANKEALWYLSNILHGLFSLPAVATMQATGDVRGGLLREGVLTSLSGILARRRGRRLASPDLNGLAASPLMASSLARAEGHDADGGPARGGSNTHALQCGGEDEDDDFVQDPEESRDEVLDGMLLAVVEGAWRSGFCCFAMDGAEDVLLEGESPPTSGCADT